MKKINIIIFMIVLVGIASAQEKSVSPSLTGKGIYHGLSQPLRDIPAMTPDEWEKMESDAMKPRNEEIRERDYPFAETALPKGDDPAWQRKAGTTFPPKAPIVSYDGQTSPYYPPDCNGAIGPNHFMQTINTVYAIYSRTGTLLAGPTNMNLLFGNVTGANCNDGDPLVLYDEQAGRWVAVEFSICGSNNYMLFAVSQTNDPTGAWHRYSFDVDDMPDYEKVGIWSDGYYMGTNNDASGKKDIYVFERAKMLSGLTAQMVGFDNPWRPTTIDGFVCVPPVDNDGQAAPSGSPGLFIAFNDDAIGGGSDQLWIYSLSVNWTTPSASTFTRSQQISVPAFSSDFGNTWTNIKQPGTSQKLDAIPQVIMNAPQYRNFGTYQTIVCCHTVDVDATDHAGIRWYELRKTTGTWSLRQSGTYAPDANSRWMGSIRLNNQNEIGLGYSISSSTVYPGIRYTGQSATAYAAGAGVLDLAEQTIITGSYAQTGAERWGDYSSICIDPSDDKTFWYTTQYPGSGGSRKTRVASFQVGSASAGIDLVVQNPTATPVSVQSGQTTTLSCTVANSGTQASAACALNYYLSSDNAYNTSDILLSTNTVSALAAGGNVSLSKSVTIPSATTAGTWYILFFADAGGIITETNETNNIAAVQVTVTSAAGLPDLTVLAPTASPTTLTAGTITTSSCTVKNSGNASAAASSLKYYLSADNVYSATDVYLATSSVSTLSAGSSATLTANITIPAATPAGSYYLLFFADADGQVTESNETNNVGSVLLTIQAVSQGCNSTSQYPGSTLTPTTSWKVQKYIYAGEYTVFSVTAGQVYYFSYCTADGGNASYDSELTLRNKSTNAFLAYSDNFCGDDAKIVWTATYTGLVKLVTTASGCKTNSTNTTLSYKYSSASKFENYMEEAQPEFTVYPNPCKGSFRVSSTSGFEGMKEIVVYNSSGKLIRNVFIPAKPENSYSFDLREYPSGLFLLKVVGEERSVSFKVVVQD